MFGKMIRSSAFQKRLKEMRDEVKPRKLKQVPDSMKSSLPFGRKSGGGFLKGVKKSLMTQAKKKSSAGSNIKRSGKYVK